MSYFIIKTDETNDKVITQILEKENISFSDYVTRIDLILEGCINDKLINNEEFNKLMLDKDEFVEEVICRIVDTNIFDEVDQIIDDEIDYLIKEIMIADNTVISTDTDKKSEEENLVIQIDME